MWDERYADSEYIYGIEPNSFLKDNIDKLPLGKALCLAEGEGRNGVFLAQQGFDVTAVDASSVGLQKAEKLAEKKGVHITTVHSDLAHYTIGPESVDVIVSIFCHIPPDIRRQLHRQVVAGLRPGGVLLLEAYTPRQLTYKTGGPPVPELTMSLDLLHEELQGLRFELAQEIDREVVEGKFHTGLGAVVQVIAVKE